MTARLAHIELHDHVQRQRERERQAVRRERRRAFLRQTWRRVQLGVTFIGWGFLLWVGLNAVRAI